MLREQPGLDVAAAAAAASAARSAVKAPGNHSRALQCSRHDGVMMV